MGSIPRQSLITAIERARLRGYALLGGETTGIIEAAVPKQKLMLRQAMVFSNATRKLSRFQGLDDT
jgi:hypothetical protein